MFNEVEGGTLEDIQGLPCWVPTVGKIWDPISDKWLNVGVTRRRPQFSECFWEPDPRWQQWKAWEREEVTRQKNDPGYRHAELNKFKKEMWQHRRGGYWYYNNDKPTYITGDHWYFLSVYHMDIGLPKYRDVDRQYFYAWDYAVGDPDAYGIIEVTKRRSGKSYRAGCILLNGASMQENFVCGIQSKNEQDAGLLFRKCIIAPYRKLPQFFKPEKCNLKDSGTVAYKTGLKFEDNGNEFDDYELSSKIDAQPSSEAAYDGQKLKRLIQDEIGKTSEVDIYDRLRTNIPCLEDDENNIIGKAIGTTTVEDMGPDNTAFLDLWADSDQRRRTTSGRTVSGFYNLFFAADETRELDRYGFANREVAREKVLSRRIGKDARSLSQEKRKNPLTIEEALQTDAASCVFNPEILNHLEDMLRGVDDKLYRRGNFHWKDGVRDTEVVFKDNPEGKFKIAWMPDEGLRNKKTQRGNHWIPGTREGGEIGIDPYDHRVLAERGQYSMSLGAIVGLKRPDPFAAPYDMPDGGPAFIYLNRPDNPDTFYEDAIMVAHFYGWRCLIETNKPGCQNYFEDRFYKEYTHQIVGKAKRGIDASAQTKGGGTAAYIAEITDQFIEDYSHTVVFLELVLQWKKFSPADTTKYDLAMAFGYAYYMMKRDLTKGKKEVKQVPVTSLMPWVRKRRVGMLRG